MTAVMQQGLEQVVVGQYRIQYEQFSDREWYPTLWKNGELVLSGWICKSKRDAEVLAVMSYWRAIGLLQSGYQQLDYRLLAMHPLNKHIASNTQDWENNIDNLVASIKEHGNLTDRYPLVISPDGLIASGNTRRAAFEKIVNEAIATNGVPDVSLQKVWVFVEESKDDRESLLVGNNARQKSDMMLAHEARVKAAIEASKSGKSNVPGRGRILEIFLESGRSKGVYYAAEKVKEFLSTSPAKRELKEAVADIAHQQSATIAEEIINLGDPNSVKKLEGKYPGIEAGKVYPGLQQDVADLKRTGDQRSVPKIVADLLSKTEDEREEVIAEKTGKQVEVKKPSQIKSLFDQLREKKLDPNDAWDTNAQTAEAIAAILGEIDIDPFASAEGFKSIKAKKYLTIFDDPMTQDWHGVVGTNFPFSIQTPAFKSLCQQITKGIITKACFITEAALLFGKEGQSWLKQIPFTYCLVRRTKDNSFGFTPSGYLLDNFPNIGTDSNRAYNVIWYFGDEPEKFAAIAGKFGEIAYSQKALDSYCRSQFLPKWEGSENGYTTCFQGFTLELTQEDDLLWAVHIDGDRLPNLYSYPEAESLAIATALLKL